MSSNRSKISFKEGYDLALQNAQSLFSIAVKAAVHSEFGIACSLNILAAEEALKAIFLIIQHYNPDSKLNHFKEIFGRHDIKHAELKNLLKAEEILQEMAKKNLKQIEPSLKYFKTVPAERLNKELYDSINDDVEWYKAFTSKKLNTAEILEWLSSANKDKNNGFYVDKKGESWSTPKTISENKFLKEKKHTEDIFDLAKRIEETFERISNSQKRS